MAKRIELDKDTDLRITNDGRWVITGLGAPIPLSAEAREQLLAALLMEEGS